MRSGSRDGLPQALAEWARNQTSSKEITEVADRAVQAEDDWIECIINYSPLTWPKAPSGQRSIYHEKFDEIIRIKDYSRPARPRD